MIYKLSHEAEKDLENIWLYKIENWSRNQANRYLYLIFEEIDYLCLKPNSVLDYGYIRKGYFRSKVKSHFIFYKFNLKKEELEVIRVLHQMMYLEN